MRQSRRELEREDKWLWRQSVRQKFTFNDDGTVASTNINESGMFRWSWKDEVSGEMRHAGLWLSTFVCIYHAMSIRGPTTGTGDVTLYEIMETGMILAGHTPTRDDEARLRSAVIGLFWAMRQWNQLSEFLLEYSYIMLKNRNITHYVAASYASMMLRQTIKPDAWRKRVTTWAEDAGLPKIEQRKRQAQTTSAEDD